MSLGRHLKVAPVAAVLYLGGIIATTRCTNAMPVGGSQHPARALARGRVLPLEQVANTMTTVDGNLAEWEPLSTQSTIIHQTLDHLSGPLAPGSKDAAVIKIRRDDRALYAAVRVVDASVVNTFEPERYFMGDCIELFLDVRPLSPARGRKLGDTIYSDGVYQLLIVPPTGDGKPLRWKQLSQAQKQLGPITIAGQLLADGYAVEMRIPFTSFANASKERFTQPIGFDVMLDDKDADQQESVPQQRVYSWGGLGNAFRDPSRFACAWPGYRNPLPAPGVRVIPSQLAVWDRKRWMRTSLITTGALAAAQEAVTLKYHFAGSEFDRTTPSQPPSNDNLVAQPDISAATPVETTDYPQLGVVIHTRALELKKLPPGRYSFNTSFAALPGLTLTTRYYGRSQGGDAYLQELSTESQHRNLLESIATSAAYIRPSSHYPIVGQPIPGTVSLWPHPRVWWELSERAQYNQPPYRLRLDVARSPGARPVYSLDIPISNALPAPFVIPAGKLPAGAYHITASVVPPTTSSQVSTRPISWQEEALGRTFVQTPAVPLVVMAPRQTVLATTLQDATRVLSKAVEIGSPNREHFPQDDAADARARSVWDMHYYQGRIYVGCGEWTDNRGPIDIWSYGYADGGQQATWRKEFTVDDESVDIFRDYNGKLYVPGIDAREEWDFGNLYIKSGNRWEKRRTVVNGIHVLDAAKFKGKLYVTTGTDTGAALFESTNEGQSWTRRGESWPEGRFYEMAPLREFLLIMPTQARQGAYKYLGGKLQRLLVPLFPELPPHAYPMPQRLQPFGNGAVYTVNSYWTGGAAPAPLFFLNDFQQGAVSVQQFQTDRVTDVVVRDGKCYVLTANTKGDATAGDATAGAIYSSSDLKAWTRLARFSVPALPQSLEMMNGTFYVGLATRNPEAADAASGSIWAIQE